MKKLSKYLWFVIALVLFFGVGLLLADKIALQNDLVRLHVVANSDSPEDQNIKLIVRDRINDYLSEKMQYITDVEAAKQYIKDNLATLQAVAQETLQGIGCPDTVNVTLLQEEFCRRDYDTFSLPSGIYESLRVEIGKGRGKNWWCVVFPALCTPTSTESFVSAAVVGGMDQGLANTLSGNKNYEVRFYLLDVIGKIENFFRFR